MGKYNNNRWDSLALVMFLAFLLMISWWWEMVAHIPTGPSQMTVYHSPTKTRLPLILSDHTPHAGVANPRTCNRVATSDQALRNHANGRRIKCLFCFKFMLKLKSLFNTVPEFFVSKFSLITNKRVQSGTITSRLWIYAIDDTRMIQIRTVLWIRTIYG